MKWMIKEYLCKARIESISELAKMTGITMRTLYDRISKPETLRMYELIALNDVLHFTDEDLLKLMKGAVSNG